MPHLLPVSGPFDLALTFGCGQAFRWRLEDGLWRGVVGRAEARLVPGPDRSLALETAGEDPGAVAWTRYLRLDEDPHAHLEGAEELRALPGFEPLLGLRLLRQEPWETLASFICSAAANIPKITACVEGLAARYGAPIPGSLRRAFPEPAVLARARERDLRALGLGFRAPYLLAAARRLDRDPLDWTALREAPLDEARARLMELPGVGAKIADCALLFGLDRLDAYPVDRWIRRATLELAGRARASDRELAAWAGRLGPSRGYLQQILFHLRRTGDPFPALRAAPPDAIGIFAKVPRPGLVKTRLSPPLAPAAASAVARAFLEETLRRFPPSVAGAWTLFLDGEPERWLERLAAGQGLAVRKQGPGDLGARLRRAFRHLYSTGARRAVVIGSDSPTLDPGRVAEALERLRAVDAVIGPARDGGYYLIGARPGRDALFEEIPWSTPRVVSETKRRAVAAGWSIAELPEWYDVDDVEGLRRAERDAGASCPRLAKAIAAALARGSASDGSARRGSRRNGGRSARA